MPGRLLLLAALLCLKLPAVLAQSLPAQSRLPGYQANGPTLLPLTLPPSLAAAATPAPIPTRQAAADYPPLHAPTLRFDQPLPAPALPQAPRRDQTGASVAPAYDLYQNWPEAQRKYTLPAPYTEPLPVQLLRGVLGR